MDENTEIEHTTPPPGTTWDGTRAQPDSISEQTKLAYSRRFQSLKRKFSKEAGHIVSNDEMVSMLIQRKAQYAMRSWRFYKACVMYVLKMNASQNYAAIELLADESSAGLATESENGSGKKQKSIPAHIAKELVFNLRIGHNIGDKGRRYSADACNALLATILVGLRPSEWSTAEIRENRKGKLYLRVLNGKFNSVRANGKHREIELDGINQDELDVIQNTIASFKENSERYDIYVRELNRELKRGLGELAALGRIHYRYRNVSLYSARHQFAADAKSANLPYRAVAALLGHKSQKTASWHYARKTVGSGSIKVAPSDHSLAMVSNKSPRIPSPTLQNAPKASK